uniref:L-arabinokinase n=1 Tax=Aegilops tauschii subsp. strangulata TaxID=200361 RepID=A0A453NAA5_AEGTS
MVARGSGAEEAPPPTQQRLVFAYYITGHGFGHATRALEVVRHLIGAGHDVHVVTAAPEFVFTTEIDSPSLHIRRVLLDCGAVQADALTVDRLASLEKYHQTAVVPREAILRTEVEWLHSIKADLVGFGCCPGGVQGGCRRWHSLRVCHEFQLGLHLCRVRCSSWKSSSLNCVADSRGLLTL